jgi:hypothetical protein
VAGEEVGPLNLKEMFSLIKQQEPPFEAIFKRPAVRQKHSHYYTYCCYTYCCYTYCCYTYCCYTYCCYTYCCYTYCCYTYCCYTYCCYIHCCYTYRSIPVNNIQR